MERIQFVCKVKDVQDQAHIMEPTISAMWQYDEPDIMKATWDNLCKELWTM